MKELAFPALALEIPENSISVSVSVSGFGALPDGKTDSTEAFNKALSSEISSGKIRTVYVPQGTYIISSALIIDSDTELVLHPDAQIKLASGAMKRRGDFMLTNRHHDGGDRNITIRGGSFDGNCSGNPRGEIFDSEGYSGAMFNFRNVDGLSVTDTVLKNSAGYFTRNCRVKNFVYGAITFVSDEIVTCNDGIHLGGFCENGFIFDLAAHTPHTPNDDVVALNADDCITRVGNLDMECGYIRNIKICGISVKECHTFVRMLSVDSEISNISVHGIAGGCSEMAINMDGARYCRTPLIPQNDKRYHGGTGKISNVFVRDCFVHSTRAHGGALVRIETNADNFTIKNFCRTGELDCKPLTKTMLMTNVSECSVEIAGFSAEKALYNGKLIAESGKTQGKFKFESGGVLEIASDGFDKLIINKTEN